MTDISIRNTNSNPFALTRLEEGTANRHNGYFYRRLARVEVLLLNTDKCRFTAVQVTIPVLRLINGHGNTATVVRAPVLQRLVEEATRKQYPLTSADREVVPFRFDGSVMDIAPLSAANVVHV